MEHGVSCWGLGWTQEPSPFLPQDVTASISQGKTRRLERTAPAQRRTGSRCRPSTFTFTLAAWPGGCRRVLCKAPTHTLSLLSPDTSASAQASQPSSPALLPPPQPAGGLAHTNLAEWTPATRLPAASPPALTKGSSPMGPGVRVCPLPRRPGEAQGGGAPPCVWQGLERERLECPAQGLAHLKGWQFLLPLSVSPLRTS